MLLLLAIALVIWLVIGFGFGLRARQKYHHEISSYPMHYRQNPRAVKFDAFVDASITLLGWMTLGLLAAVAFVAWRAWEMYLAETKRHRW